MAGELRPFSFSIIISALLTITSQPLIAQDADVDNTTPAAQAENPGTLISRADVAFRENQLEDALQLYKQALKAQPSSAHARARIIEIEQILRSSSAPVAPAGNDPDLKPTSTGKGGATKYTENMPMNVAELVAERAKRVNEPEFRSAWVTRFDWTSKDASIAQTKILKTFQDAEQVGLNAVLFQCRSEATTMYPSKLEPWSRLVGGKDPGFDPLNFAISEAHKRGIELHAYVNPIPVSDEKDGPTDPAHVWHKHCTPTSNPNWLVYRDGKPAAFNEYWWFNPNLPEVQTYIRQALVDLVLRYDIDGLHYDRIRFPSSDVSDDPWSMARFQGEGNPMGLSFKEWQRDNIVRMLTDVYACIMAVKPKVKVSAAVWGIYDKTKLPQGSGPSDRANSYSWASTGLQDYHQDSMGFINKGCVDALVPMIYWDMGGNKPDYDELVCWFKENVKNGRHIYGGQRIINEAEMLRQAVATDRCGAEGTCPFTLNGLVNKGMAGFYRKNIYPNKVPTTPMPWKTSYDKAILLVTVKNAQGAPVMDAHVKLGGRDYVWLSSADGFCGIIDADPGQGKTLSVVKKNGGTANVPLPALEPGKAIPVAVVLQ